MKTFILFLLFLSTSVFAEIKPDTKDASREKITVDKRENYFQTSAPLKITPNVNPITGDLIEEETDLFVAGVEPLSIRRFYTQTAPYEPRYGGWLYNPETYLVANFQWEGQELFAAVGSINGGIISTKPSSQEGYTFTFDKINSLTHFESNGQTHPLNTKITYRKIGDKDDKYRFSWQGEVTDGSGCKRFYASNMHRWLNSVSYTSGKKTFLTPGSKYELKYTSNVWTPYQLPIYEEKRPNGNIISYSYVRHKDDHYYPKPVLLSTITAYNSDKSKVLGYIQFNYNKDKRDDVRGITCTGSDGRQIAIQHAGSSPILLNAVYTPNKPWSAYGYYGQYLTRVEKPEGRAITTEYHSDGKVAAQNAPVGPNGEMCPIGRYTYGARETEVLDAEGHKTIYYFDENKRLHAIVTYYEGEKNYRIDRFKWDGNGNLIRKTAEAIPDHPLFFTDYLYDANQNPIEEKMGDGTTWHTIQRTFSTDGFNLKLSESDREGKEIRYGYKPGTNLLTSEIVFEHGKIRKRTFLAYDDCACLIKTISDDGRSLDTQDLTDVTFRKIIEIEPRKEKPCFGLPETILEKTIDATGQEILLGKVVYTYEPSGKTREERHYDSTGEYHYNIVRKYDTQERLISQTDSLKNITEFQYDENNNLTAVLGPKLDQCKKVVYDKANRPIRMIDLREDGSVLTIEKKYDRLGQVIAEVDACGNTTHFKYDASGRVTAILHPDGALERKEYDVFGNIIKTVDAEGYEIRSTYDFHGKPLSIYYPDGKEEHFTYNTSGTIATQIDKNGSKIAYQYDIFDNPIRIEVYSSSNQLLKVTTATFSPYCKLSETDGEGITTTYRYDFAGRKIAEQTDTKKILCFYDDLGRLVKSDTHYFQTSVELDNSDKPVVKKIVDDQGQLQFQETYEYDEAGNRTHLINSHGIFETVYNTFGKPLSEKNPLGFSTTHDYVFGKEYVETATNANGIQTIRIFDMRGQEVETLKKNKLGDIISKYVNRYNKNGNLIEKTHLVFDGTQYLKTITHQWEYGPMGRIERFIEAGEKETRYLYDGKGRLKTIIKPSGIQLNHEWDDLGRLTRYFSSDFDYHYKYDRNNRLISIYDTISKKTTSRSYNALGGIKEEILGNGLKLSNHFDESGRRVILVLPDGSQIDYVYLGAYLYSVNRKGLNYTYNSRDLEGYVLEAELPNNLGNLKIVRDALSRWKKVEFPFFSSKFSKDAYDPIGNLLKYQYQDSAGKVDCAYLYDDLNQLISENGHTYIFDSLNNRLKKDDFTHEVNHLCQTTSDGQKAYQYDRDGNLISDGKWRYTYDSQDRLTALENGSQRIEFEYDSFHRRLSKKVFSNGKPTKIERYLWDGENEIGAADEKGNIQQLRILGEGLGAEIGSAVLYELQGKSFVPIHDHRGSVVCLIDLENKKIENYRYTSFGEELTNNKLSPWRFSSKRAEDETGLVFFGRRYYFPSLGKWITQDPQGFADGPNLYAYLSNCPLNKIDLYGLYSFDDYSWPSYKPQNIINNINQYGCPKPHRNYWKYDNKSPIQSRPYSLNELGYDLPELKHGQIIFTNGMDNTFDEAIHHSLAISKISGYNTHGIYNASNGKFIDGCESILNIFNHAITTPVFHLAQKANAFFETHTNGEPLLMIGHSQGCSQIRNYLEICPENYRKRIIASLFAPAAYVSQDLCKHVTHYVCDSDSVTYADTARNKSKYGETIIHINRDPAINQSCHQFLNPIYAPHLQTTILEYIERLNIYEN